MRSRKNVFILDCDEAVLARLSDLKGAEDCEFHGLFHAKTFAERDGSGIGELLQQAEERLSFFNGAVDAVIGFRGFPVNMMTAVVAHDLDLPGLRPSAVLKCEHRYWTRLEIRRAFELRPEDAACPRFARIDWGSIEFAPLPPFEPPLLLKPVLLGAVPGAGEPLEIRVGKGEEFSRALRRFGRVPRTNGDLDYFLEHVDVPQELLDMRGEGVFAEEWVRGSHHRADVYCRDGQVTVYGLIDTHWEPDGGGVRFEYPSRVSPVARERMERAVRRITEVFGLEGGAFAVDFVFPETGSRRDPGVPLVAGVSAGISSAFSGLYERVDGASCFQVAFDLALRKRPSIQPGKGAYPRSARYLLHGPGRMVSAELPSAERIEEVEREYGATVRLFFDSGFTVADRYIFGAIEVGGEDPEELAGRYEAVRRDLGIRFHERRSRAA